MQTERREAAWFVILSGIAFATSGPFARLARPAHPFLIAFGRVFVASIILAAIGLPGLRRSVQKLTQRQAGLIALAGALLGVHFALFLWGLEETSFAAAMSLISLEPLSVVMFAWMMFGIRPTAGQRTGVLIATCGAIVVSQGSGSGDHRMLGDLLVIGAVILFGLYVAVARHLGGVLPAHHYAALVYAAAAITLGPIVLVATPDGFAQVSSLPTASLGWIVAMGILPTVIGHTLVQAAAGRLPPAIVGLVSPGETVGAIAIGALALGAVPTALELCGGLVIIAGTTFAIVRGAPPAPNAATNN